MGHASSKSTSSLDCHIVDTWDKKTVAEWLSSVGFSRCSKEFQNRDIDGQRLCELNKSELMSFGVDGEEADRILNLINNLTTYSSHHQLKSVEFVSKKLDKLLAQDPNISQEKKMDLARKLSVKEYLMRSYLSNSLSRTEKLFEKVWGMDPTKLNEEDRLYFTFLYSAAHDSKDGIFNEASSVRNDLVLKKKDILKVYLVVIEEPRSLSFRTCCSPVCDAFPSESSRMQTALVVGPYLLSWNSYGLVVPKKIFNRMRWYVKGGVCLRGPMANDALTNIASLICEWNTKYTHKYKNDPDGTGRNCQSFVDAVCESLNIDFGNHIFLQNMRENSMRPLSIEFPLDFKLRFGIPEAIKYFLSHEQLDEFVSTLVEYYPTFPSDYPFEWNILKMIDLIFWLRHVMCKEKGDISLRYEESDHHSCLFETELFNITDNTRSIFIYKDKGTADEESTDGVSNNRTSP